MGIGRSHLRLRQLSVALFCFFLASSSALAATLPAGFTESLIATGLANPTAMAFAPDGRLFVCEQGGKLRVIKNGALVATPFVSLTVNSDGERGLLGVAFDPAFAANHFVYVYYTATTPAIHNRISRFTANGDVAAAGSEVVLLDLDNLSSASNHNGGALNFGPDGKLYAAVGENANGANAQTLGNLLGKILRINSDGSIPQDNPFAQAQGKNKAIWAMGLRNPFTFAFNPGGTEMFINDVGQSAFEEINDGLVGANYGWPNTEGPIPPPNAAGFKAPRHSYGHSGAVSGCAIAGAAFYSPATIQFPSDYANDYFFADLCSGWIRRLDLATNDSVEFATGISQPVDLKVSTDGSLYYLARGSGGVVYRITYQGSGPPPPSGLPAVPRGLTAFTNGLTLSLSWSASAGATLYVLEAGTAAGRLDVLSADIGNLTSVQGVVPAGQFFVRVKARNAQGPSAASNEVNVRLVGLAECAAPPPAPTGYTRQISGLDVVLAWQPAPSATSYVFEAGTAPGQGDVLVANVGAITAVATSAPPGLYYTRVRSVNTCGVSGPSNEVTVALACGVNEAPGLTVGKAGPVVTFNWTASPGALGYIVQVGTANGLSNVFNADVGTIAGLQVNVSGVQSGTYYVRVLKRSTCGTSAPSNQVTVQVP